MNPGAGATTRTDKTSHEQHCNHCWVCSGSKEGSYLRLIDFVYHSTLGLRVITKKKKGHGGWGGAHMDATIWIKVVTQNNVVFKAHRLVHHSA